MKWLLHDANGSKLNFKGFSHFNNFPISCNLFHYIPIKYLKYTKTNLHAVCRYNFVFSYATYNRRIHSYIKLNCIDNKEELASNLHFYFLFPLKSIWECHENAIFIFFFSCYHNEWDCAFPSFDFVKRVAPSREIVNLAKSSFFFIYRIFKMSDCE